MRGGEPTSIVALDCGGMSWGSWIYDIAPSNSPIHSHEQILPWAESVWMCVADSEAQLSVWRCVGIVVLTLFISYLRFNFCSTCSAHWRNRQRHRPLCWRIVEAKWSIKIQICWNSSPTSISMLVVAWATTLCFAELEERVFQTARELLPSRVTMCHAWSWWFSSFKS